MKLENIQRAAAVAKELEVAEAMLQFLTTLDVNAESGLYSEPMSAVQLISPYNANFSIAMTRDDGMYLINDKINQFKVQLKELGVVA